MFNPFLKWNPFKREMNDAELKVFTEATSIISKRCHEISKNPEQAFLYFRAETDEQKERVLREVNQMSYVACAHYSVLTWLHPFTWFGLGLTSKLNFGRPIALSYKALQDVQTAKEIIAHEFSHSQLKTVDGLAGKGIYSEEFYERIRDAWVWTFLF